MKKLLSMFLVIILCFSFTGCFSEGAPTKEQGEVEAATKNTETTYALNETAVFKDLKFTATQIKESDGTDFFVPEAGKVFVGIKFTIENISDEEQTVSTLMLFEGYADDIKCDYSFNAACAFNEGTLDGSVASGKKLVGWYALEVPEDWSNIELEVQSKWLSNNSAKFVFTK